jgi:NTP pyrophosphatase (non-canonical NTP hydrolase)
MKFDIDNQRPVIDYYSVTEQTIIWAEELSELTKATSKCHRNPSTGSCLDMAEEIADVLICIKQMMQVYGLTASYVQEIINEKCERQRKRMEEEKYDY